MAGNRLRAFVLALAALVLCSSAAPAEISGSDLIEGIRDKGTDWLKDRAKDAGEDWVFDTGQSETMHAILQAAEERSNGTGNDYSGKCQGAVMGQASSDLNSINIAWSVKSAGKLAFDTLTHIAGLAAGGLGAAAEGGGLSWLAQQYADAAKDKMKDSTLDALKKLFIDEKEPEYEIYETSGGGKCPYTLRAVWNIVGGTYIVYIAGDCHCNSVGNVGVMARPLGAWWASFEGKLLMKVDADSKTVTWIPQPPKFDFDAQCSCSKTPLRTAFQSRTPAKPAQPAPAPSPTPAPPSGGTPAPGPGTATAPEPPRGPQTPAAGLPPAGRKVCADCQKIQTDIDADQKALEDASVAIYEAQQAIPADQSRIVSDQDKLDAFRQNPSAYDTTEAHINQQIADDKTRLADDTKKLSDNQAEKARLEKELKALGDRLENCLKQSCPPEHSSAGGVLRDIFGHVSVGTGAGGRSREREHSDSAPVSHPATTPNN